MGKKYCEIRTKPDFGPYTIFCLVNVIQFLILESTHNENNQLSPNDSRNKLTHALMERVVETLGISEY